MQALALLRRPLCRRVAARVFSTETPQDEEEFRRFELFPKSREEKKPPRKIFFDKMEKRATKMPVDQDWPSVWPVASSFKESVVPLPIRQGYVEGNKPPLEKAGNLELMKIPNFLHLAPPAVKRHCDAIKRFCTKWPEGLTDERSANWVTISTSDYLTSGPSLRDERARVVTIRIKLSALQLDRHAKDKIIRLVGDRYNEKKDELIIVSDRCPMRHQNLDYAMYVLTALYHESRITEDWELTDIQEADYLRFSFENSRSEKYLKDYVAATNKVADETTISEYGDAISNLKNEGDNEDTLNAYKKAVCALMNMKPFERPTV